MDAGDIAQRFIRAAEIERAMPRTGERPTAPRGWQLQTVHTFADKAGWRKEIGDFLLAGDNPLAEERRAFTEGRSTRLTTEDVALWEACRLWTVELLQDPRERRALWAWSFSKVGGRLFNAWCFDVEGIHPETGRRRKDRAIVRIAMKLATDRPVSATEATRRVVDLVPSIEPKSAELEPGRRKPVNAWMAQDALSPFFGDGDFSWSQKRNQRRLERASRAGDGD